MNSDTAARKRVVVADLNLPASLGFNAEFDGTESYDDDDKRGGGGSSGPRSWVSYALLMFMFLSGLVGMGQVLRSSSNGSNSIPRGPPIQYVNAPAPVSALSAARVADPPMLRASSSAEVEKKESNIAPISGTKTVPSRPMKIPAIPALKSGESAVSTDRAIVPSSDSKEIAVNESSNAGASVEELYAKLQSQIEEVRTLKRSGVVTETSDEAKALIKELRKTCREYLLKEYGPEPYYVEMSLEFPSSMPDFATNGAAGKVLFKLGPIEHVPYSVFYFLELVKNWKGGSFHRPAGHVLQAQVNTQSRPLAFQEYSPHFPHNKHTLGYAGRPSGPGFYISTLNNVANHGPASQGSATEADACFGALVQSPEVITVVDRLKKQPGGQKPHMFVSPPSNYIKIPVMKLITSKTEGGLSVLPSTYL